MSMSNEVPLFENTAGLEIFPESRARFMVVERTFNHRLVAADAALCSTGYSTIFIIRSFFASRSTVFALHRFISFALSNQVN